MEPGDDGEKEPLSPLMPLGVAREEADDDDENEEEPKDEQNADKILADDFPQIKIKKELNYDEEEQEVADNALPNLMEDDMDNDMDNDFDNDADLDDDMSFGGAGGYGNMNYSDMGHSFYRPGAGTEDVMRREEQSHAYDRKLTRLVEQYPSIWCTRHPDYGNFEVTRKQWDVIATYFEGRENIKMRWKNIRKRFVRIERRIREGKRFNGYFDKATNFLANRDLPEDEWVEVDRGDDDGDVIDRQQLDAMEKEMYPTHGGNANLSYVGDGALNETADALPSANKASCSGANSLQPLDISVLDMRIINFVKCNPTLWRKATATEIATGARTDEESRRALWVNLVRSLPSKFLLNKNQPHFPLYIFNFYNRSKFG